MNKIRIHSLVVLLALAGESIYSVKFIQANTHETSLWFYLLPTVILMYALLFLPFTGKKSIYSVGLIVWSWMFLFIHLGWTIDAAGEGVGWALGYAYASIINVIILVVLLIISAIITKTGNRES